MNLHVAGDAGSQVKGLRRLHKVYCRRGWLCAYLEGKSEMEVSVDVREQSGEPACVHLKPHSPTPPSFRGL